MYVRPEIPRPEFRDAGGGVIPYGRRWGISGPPENAYSVTAHPERFLPLHDVARALMAELGVASSGGTVFGPQGPLESSRFEPPNNDAAPIIIALTDFPGVRIRAGAFFSAAFPSCGCDACDEGLENAVSQLESTVFAIRGGRLRESVSDGWVTHSLAFDDGSRSGNGRVEDALPALVGRDGHALRPRPWAAWG